MSLKCIAIDDEPMALEIITSFCQRYGNIELTTFNNPLRGMRAGNFEYTRMSDEMERMWTQYGDERVTVWFSPTTNSANTAIKEYAGIPSGCSSTTLTNIGYSQADVSMLGGYYRDTPDGCSAILMNCSEVKFLQAEEL